MDAFDRLVAVVARLRGPTGCAWDRAQTPESVRAYVLEEAHEVVEAIDAADAGALLSELGDLLFLVVLVARMHEERGSFDVAAALDAASDKMVRRHPHVFGEGGERAAWEAQKRAEGRRALLDGIPRALPALLRAQRIGERTAEVGFDWPDVDGVRRKLHEELAELDEATDSGSAARIEEELGDVLLTITSLARHLGVRAEDALRRATAKYEARFRAVESACALEGREVAATPPEELDRLWNAAKRSEVA
jgi:MazG family protein